MTRLPMMVQAVLQMVLQLQYGYSHAGQHAVDNAIGCCLAWATALEMAGIPAPDLTDLTAGTQHIAVTASHINTENSIATKTQRQHSNSIYASQQPT